MRPSCEIPLRAAKSRISIHELRAGSDRMSARLHTEGWTALSKGRVVEGKRGRSLGAVKFQ